MADLGFWALAQADPDHLALCLPDGTEHSAGICWAGSIRWFTD